MFARPSTELNFASAFRRFAVIALSTCLLTLAGCGSTKVYNSQKTLVHGGSIYNVTNVMVFSSRTDGIAASDETLDLRGVDKKGFRNLLEQHQAIFGRQVVTLDEREVVYQARQVDSWSDFRKMDKRFSSIVEDLQDFLANPKKTQLELK